MYAQLIFKVNKCEINTQIIESCNKKNTYYPLAVLMGCGVVEQPIVMAHSTKT